MEILNKQLSPEAQVKMELKEGKIRLTGVLDTKGLDFATQLSLDSDYFIDELARIIPGPVDNAIFEVLKAALKQIA